MPALMPISFASAYRQLSPGEKSFVDTYVATIERDAHKANERISNALHRPIPAEAVQASRGMLEKPMVLAAISERVTTLAADQELSPARLVKEMANIAFSSIAHYQTIDADGMPSFDLSRCTPEQLAALKKVKFKESMTLRGPVREFEIELFNKQDALETMMKYVGMLADDNPFWRAETARPANAVTLPADTSVEDAANRYAALING